MASVLVTGATSSLARVVAKYLKSLGHRVVGTSRNAGAEIDHTFDNILITDFLDSRSIMDVSGSFDAVIHIAAASVGLPKDIMKVTGFGTESLVQRAIQLGVRQFVFVSSMAVYGSPKTGIVSSTTPVGHGTQFGSAKWYAESSINRAVGNINGFCVRSPAIVGQAPYRHFLGFLLEEMREKRPIIKVSNPRFEFNNIIHEITLGKFLADLALSSHNGFHAFPVASSDTCQLRDVIAHMVERTEYTGTISWVHQESPPFSIDINYAKTLGLQPWTTRETLKRWLP